MHPAIHIAIWGIALIMTGMAFFVKRYPHTMAGYNTLSDEKKKNVDLQGMVRFAFKGMLAATWSMVPLVYLATYLTGDDVWVIYGMAIWLPVGIIIVAILAQKFDHNRKKTN